VHISDYLSFGIVLRVKSRMQSHFTAA